MNDKEQTTPRASEPFAYELLDPKALMVLANVVQYGADKYWKDSWRGLTIPNCIRHMLGHLYKFMIGDKTENHLGHMLCNAFFIVGLYYQDKDYIKIEQWADGGTLISDYHTGAMPYTCANLTGTKMEG
jgi:hypothetical protein